MVAPRSQISSYSCANAQLAAAPLLEQQLNTKLRPAVCGQAKRKVYVNRVRVPKRSAEQEKRLEVNSSKLFVFCDKSSGIAQFRAESNVDLNYTVERIGGLLAMQCLVRGHDPDDFLVLVPADATVVGRLVSRAKEILEEGRVLAGPAPLSPRQSEILRSVICNRANKEIASKLNITVRTVKFHISSLLNKFGVDNRTDLARRAAGLIRPAPRESEEPFVADPMGEARRPPLDNASLDRSSITSRSIVAVPNAAAEFARKSSTSHVHRPRQPHGRFRETEQLQSGRRQPLNIAEEDHNLPDLLVG
jgi:DNA-binding CsgD family transcriptional regulator